MRGWRGAKDNVYWFQWRCHWGKQYRANIWPTAQLEVFFILPDFSTTLRLVFSGPGTIGQIFRAYSPPPKGSQFIGFTGPITGGNNTGQKFVTSGSRFFSSSLISTNTEDWCLAGLSLGARIQEKCQIFQVLLGVSLGAETETKYLRGLTMTKKGLAMMILLLVMVMEMDPEA